MIYTIKKKSKHLNLKRSQFFLTWFKISIKLVPINFKWLIVMIGYKKLAYGFFMKCVLSTKASIILFLLKLKASTINISLFWSECMQYKYIFDHIYKSDSTIEKQLPRRIMKYIKCLSSLYVYNSNNKLFSNFKDLSQWW